MRRVFALIACALMNGSAAAETCARNPYGVFEELDCASAAAQEADARLNREYEELRRSLDAEQRKRLLASQRAWLMFVRAETDFIYSVNGDGADGRLVVINFREAESRRRADALQEWKRR